MIIAVFREDFCSCKVVGKIPRFCWRRIYVQALIFSKYLME